MILTGEGALLAVALAALVGGVVGAWALLLAGLRRPRRGRGKPRVVRRVIVPAGAAPKV
jgi:hypothetical protein